MDGLIDWCIDELIDSKFFNFIMIEKLRTLNKVFFEKSLKLILERNLIKINICGLFCYYTNFNIGKKII